MNIIEKANVDDILRSIRSLSPEGQKAIADGLSHRELTSQEFGELIERMIAAREAGNTPLARELQEEVMRGFYGEDMPDA
jgi:hypothetical protein